MKSPSSSLLRFNLFQSEALAMINPFLKDMTKSELHAALTGGFASISGSILGAYIGLGVRWTCRQSYNILHFV